MPDFHLFSNGPRPVAPFSHAVEADGWVILTGQMPTDPAAPDAPLPEGIEAQTRRVMDNLVLILAELGLDLSHVVKQTWHILRDPGALTLARHLPPRFDVAAEAAMPPMRKGRLARQIRQDMWRALRHLRGFSPVVRVEEVSAGLHVTAGGRVAARVFPKAAAEARIAELLADPAHRARWARHAGGV